MSIIYEKCYSIANCIKILLLKCNKRFYNLFAKPYGLSILFSPIKITLTTVLICVRRNMWLMPTVVIRTKRFKQKHKSLTYNFKTITWFGWSQTHINSLWYWIFAVRMTILLKEWLVNTFKSKAWLDHH